MIIIKCARCDTALAVRSSGPVTLTEAGVDAEFIVDPCPLCNRQSTVAALLSEDERALWSSILPWMIRRHAGLSGSQRKLPQEVIRDALEETKRIVATALAEAHK